jgi:DNA-binding transcriptional MerR regulator
MIRGQGSNLERAGRVDEFEGILQLRLCMTIGQVAKQAGLSVETIRFYERRGLIPEPERTPSGYRQYAPRVVDQIKFIRHARELGFSLKEISELLALRDGAPDACGRVEEMTRRKIVDLDSQLQKTTAALRTLRGLIETSEQHQCDAECRLLTQLDSAS